MPTEHHKLNWNALMEEALTAPGNLHGVYDRFHEYSFTNYLLFMMQGIHEPVASYTRWQSLGRHVLQGAKAKEVIVPIIVKEKAPAPAPEGESIEQKRERLSRLIGFKVVRGVFALSDTDGEDPPPAPIPSWDLSKALDKLGIRRVPFDEMNGNVQGYSRGLDIAINPVAAHPTKTLFHEIGHVVLGHTMPRSLGEYASHRGLKEFEAEGTAYLVMNELELVDEETASHSRGYIKHWLEDEQPPEASIRNVFRAADAILKAGRGEES